MSVIIISRMRNTRDITAAIIRQTGLIKTNICISASHLGKGYIGVRRPQIQRGLNRVNLLCIQIIGHRIAATMLIIQPIS